MKGQMMKTKKEKNVRGKVTRKFKMNFSTMMAVADAMDIGKEYNSIMIGSKTGMTGYYVKFMMALMIKCKVCEKAYEIGNGGQIYVRRLKDVDISDDSKVMFGITAGFNDFQSLSKFTELSDDILNNCLDWLVAEKEIATYVENKKSKPFYKKIPLLSFIYPVHIPTNLVKETLVIDGKVKSVKKISRQMELV